MSLVVSLSPVISLDGAGCIHLLIASLNPAVQTASIRTLAERASEESPSAEFSRVIRFVSSDGRTETLNGKPENAKRRVQAGECKAKSASGRMQIAVRPADEFKWQTVPVEQSKPLGNCPKLNPARWSGNVVSHTPQCRPINRI